MRRSPRSLPQNVSPSGPRPGVGYRVTTAQRHIRPKFLRGYGHPVQIHKKLRAELDQWLEERPHWPHAETNRALFLNAKGGRLTARAASGIIHTIAHNAALDDQPTAHILRHTLATTLVRGHTDLVIVAELLGHSRLETTRRYSLPTEKDKADALNLITIDR